MVCAERKREKRYRLFLQDGVAWSLSPSPMTSEGPSMSVSPAPLCQGRTGGHSPLAGPRSLDTGSGAGHTPGPGRKLGGHLVYQPVHVLRLLTPPHPGLRDGGRPRVSGSRSYQVPKSQRFGFPGRDLLPLPSPQGPLPFFPPPLDSSRAVGRGHRGTAPVPPTCLPGAEGRWWGSEKEEPPAMLLLPAPPGSSQRRPGAGRGPRVQLQPQGWGLGGPRIQLEPRRWGCGEGVRAYSWRLGGGVRARPRTLDSAREGCGRPPTRHPRPPYLRCPRGQLHLTGGAGPAPEKLQSETPGASRTCAPPAQFADPAPALPRAAPGPAPAPAHPEPPRRGGGEAWQLGSALRSWRPGVRGRGTPSCAGLGVHRTGARGQLPFGALLGVPLGRESLDFLRALADRPGFFRL